ncbi:MAG: Na(+)-translocating NADH-quinone reductase subunit C [Betaproteobacteria bacterium]
MADTTSTRYTIVFAAIVCIVCAVVVASSAVGLRSRQETNALVFRQQNVLLAAGLVKSDEALSNRELQAIFDRRIVVRLVDLATGDYAEGGAIDPRTYDQRRARNDPALSRAAPPNAAKIARLPTYGAVYGVRDEAREGVEQLVVLPIEGIGMWGTLYGFLAIDRDGRTIRGLTFYDQKETPGLGGEISNPQWQALWVGRKAFDANWEPKLTVIKGNAGTPEQDPHRVDAISGATITSNSVSRLVGFWLGSDGYGRFLQRYREGSKG